MKKFLSFAFRKRPLVQHSNPFAPAHQDEAYRHWVEDYITTSSDMDAVWYYERRRWRA